MPTALDHIHPAFMDLDSTLIGLSWDAAELAHDASYTCMCRVTDLFPCTPECDPRTYAGQRAFHETARRHIAGIYVVLCDAFEPLDDDEFATYEEQAEADYAHTYQAWVDTGLS